MQAQKFYTGTKKDVVHHYIFFFTGSIEVYVRYRADFLALKKIKVFKKFFAFLAGIIFLGKKIMSKLEQI